MPRTELTRFRLRFTGGGIRIWHASLLLLAVAVLVADALLQASGSAVELLPWPRGQARPLIAALAVVGLLSRTVLVAIAWGRGFPELYPRVVLPLLLACHVCSAVVFGAAAFRSQTGYLVVLSILGFASGMMNGLTCRQTLWVALASVGGMLCCAIWPGTPMSVAAPDIATVTLCYALAVAIAAALDASSGAMFQEHLKAADLALHDGLTGLKNRRAFDEYLMRLWHAALREERMMALLFIDVDHFKAYNDSQGHLAGDRVLQRVANAVRDIARRPLDLAARYGGDELAVILVDVSWEDAVRLAEQVHALIRDMGVDWHEAGVSRRVSISTGVAHVGSGFKATPLDIVQLADQALYSAKRAGRGRIAVLARPGDSNATWVFEPEPG